MAIRRRNTSKYPVEKVRVASRLSRQHTLYMGHQAEPVRYGIYVPPAMRKGSPICQWSLEDTSVAAFIPGVKGKLIYPGAYACHGLQTALFYHIAAAAQQPPSPQLSSKKLNSANFPLHHPHSSPSAPLSPLSACIPVMSPLNRQGGVAFPVPVSLTSPCPSLTSLSLSLIPQIISKGPGDQSWPFFQNGQKWGMYLVNHLFEGKKRPHPSSFCLATCLFFFFSPQLSHVLHYLPPLKAVLNMQRK